MLQCSPPMQTPCTHGSRERSLQLRLGKGSTPLMQANKPSAGKSLDALTQLEVPEETWGYMAAEAATGRRYPLQMSTGAWELLTLFLTSHKCFLLLGILNERLSFQARPWPIQRLTATTME